MARRLIEAGVPFVEVTLGGWDTHQQNFERVQKLSAELDPAMGSLIRELWSEGQKPTADEILLEVTGARLELEAAAERVRESLAAV